MGFGAFKSARCTRKTGIRFKRDKVIHRYALWSTGSSYLFSVTILILERMETVEHHPLIRLGALFGLYTFYGIQPEVFECNIRAVQYIKLTIGS